MKIPYPGLCKGALTLLFFSLSVLLCSAQDVIVLKSGEELRANVLEVGAAEVKYRKAEHTEGPIYVLMKTDIFMIKYGNGSKDVFQSQPGTAVAGNAPKADEITLSKYRKKLGTGIGLTATGGALFFTGVPVMVYGIHLNNLSDTYNTVAVDGTVPGVTGAILTVVSIPFLIVGPIQISKAIKLKRQAQSGVSFHVEPKMFSPLPGAVKGEYGLGAHIQLKF